MNRRLALILVPLLAWTGCAADRSAGRAAPLSPAPATNALPASVSPAAPAQSLVAPTHLALMRGLVRDVPPGATKYQHNPTVVIWEAGPDGGPACRADCSGLLNEVFKRSFGLSDQDLTEWLKSKRPLAMHYHLAIRDRRGFDRIEDFALTRPGDVIATRYEPGAGNSGHVMVVDEPPQREARGAREPGGEVVPFDAALWRVRVIDASRTGHGPGDSRFVGDRRVRNGLGSGYFRVATDPRGEVVAHAFGTASTDAWHSVNKRPLMVGRVLRPEGRASSVAPERRQGAASRPTAAAPRW